MYLILFLCVPLVTALILIRVAEMKKRRKYEEFLQAVRKGAEAAVPETAGFEIVMAQGAKDAVSAVPGYDRIQTGYASLPSFIVRYRENEMYIMAVPYPSGTDMTVDREFILHITADILKEVKFGPMGKVSFYFKDSSRFFAMTVTEYAIPLLMQLDDSKRFKSFIKGFAEKVNGEQELE